MHLIDCYFNVLVHVAEAFSKKKEKAFYKINKFLHKKNLATTKGSVNLFRKKLVIVWRYVKICWPK